MADISMRKSIAQILFLVATALLLIFCSCYLMILGIIAVCVWTLPVIIAVQKNGIAAGIGVGLAATVLTALFIDTGTAVFVLGLMGVLGVFYGIRIKRKDSNPLHSMLIGITIVVALALAIFGILVAAGILDLSAAKASIEDSMHKAFDVYNQSLKSSDLAGQGASLKKVENEAITLTLQIIPGVLLSLIITVAGLNYIIADRFLKKRNFEFQSLPLFREWHFPWWILWGLLIALGLLVFGNGTDNNFYVVIAKNIFFCYAPLMILSGISFTRWIMVRWRLSSGFCALIWVAAVLFLSVSLVFFMITGVADTMFDYRNSFNKSIRKEERK